MLQESMSTGGERQRALPRFEENDIPNPTSRSRAQSFNLKGAPKPLAGGQGETYVLESVVLKPAHNSLETEWLCNIQTQLLRTPNPLYRLVAPITIPNSNPPRYIAHGWTAMTFITGAPDSNHRIRINELLPASRAMHADLRALVLAQPDFIRQKRDRWSCADRIAWDEVKIDATPDIHALTLARLTPWLDRLFALRQPLVGHHVQSQVVHADLSGNILFAPPGQESSVPPAILDFSPSWRPVEYAEAIVVADGLTWQEEGQEMARIPGLDWYRLQMLVRALIFRVVTYAIQFDEAFVESNMGRMDVERGVRIVERLCLEEEENEGKGELLWWYRE